MADSKSRKTGKRTSRRAPRRSEGSPKPLPLRGFALRDYNNLRKEERNYKAGLILSAASRVAARMSKSERLQRAKNASKFAPFVRKELEKLARESPAIGVVPDVGTIRKALAGCDFVNIPNDAWSGHG